MLRIGDIHLRALEFSDLELLYQWENDTDIWKVSNTITPFSKQMLNQYLEHAKQDIFTSKQLRLIIVKNHDPIGTIELFDYEPIHMRAGIGIWIANKQERNKGYAKDAITILINYAFNHLQLNQLYCNISSSNKNSINLFSKLGFILIGVKKNWNKIVDRWEDELLFQKFCD
jgi:diamine N-acetyltransferase